MKETEELFHVAQFFQDETYEYVRSSVPAKEAVEAAKHYTSSVGAQIGTTTAVVIVDGGDNTVFRWEYGRGIVWPTPEQRQQAPAEEATMKPDS